MSKIIMALDQGTTSSRTILYNEKGEPIALVLSIRTISISEFVSYNYNFEDCVLN